MNQFRTLSFLTFIFLATACSNNSESSPMSQPSQPIAIALHGGAGNIEKMNLSEEEKSRYLFVMDSALQIGHAILQNGGSSTDAVEKVICALEDCPLFNAGKGAVFSHEGRNEMDAAIMNGSDLECGAIAGVRHVKNPIIGARTVMEKSKHILLYGVGAEEFLKKKDVEMVDTSYFFTQKRWDQLQKALEKNTNGLDHDENSGDNKYGTVGCVALDLNGNLSLIHI
jgi:beta-aspartyl-peptidase (threonine type)